MYMKFLGVFVLVFAVSSAAMAGELGMADHHITWQSTQCQAPVTPNLMAVPETAADEMNARVTRYNQYAQLAQDYMNCISNESSRDATTASQIIVNAGQATITDVQNTLERLATTVEKRQ